MGDRPATPEDDGKLMTAEMTTQSLDPLVLQEILSRHLAMYRSKVPVYQAVMLDSVRE